MSSRGSIRRVTRPRRASVFGGLLGAWVLVALQQPNVSAQTFSPTTSTTTPAPTLSSPPTSAGVGSATTTSTTVPVTGPTLSVFGLDGGVGLREYRTGESFGFRVVVTNNSPLPYSNVQLVVRLPAPASAGGGTVGSGIRVGLIDDDPYIWYHLIAAVPPNSSTTYVVIAFMPCAGRWSVAVRLGERTVVEPVEFVGATSPRCGPPTTAVDSATDLRWPPTPVTSAPTPSTTVPATAPLSSVTTTTRLGLSPTAAPTTAAPTTAPTLAIPDARPRPTRARVVLRCTERKRVRTCKTVPVPVTKPAKTTIPRTAPAIVLGTEPSPTVVGPTLPPSTVLTSVPTTSSSTVASSALAPSTASLPTRSATLNVAPGSGT